MMKEKNTMYSKEESKQSEKDQQMFNAITNKKEVENQNQTHNVREEGIHPINQKR